MKLSVDITEKKTGRGVNHCQQRTCFSNDEKEKRAAELSIANKELEFIYLFNFARPAGSSQDN